MKNTRTMKIIAALAALCMTAAMFGGCSKNKTDTSDTTVSASDENTSAAATQRPVAEGDIYAINKFKVKDLPENYVMAQKSQEDFDQHFRYIIDDGQAQMAVYAANYAEDYGPIDDFIGRIRFSMTFNNVMYKCDTEFTDKIIDRAVIFGIVCCIKVSMENGAITRSRRMSLKPMKTAIPTRTRTETTSRPLLHGTRADFTASTPTMTLSISRSNPPRITGTMLSAILKRKYFPTSL